MNQREAGFKSGTAGKETGELRALKAMSKDTGHRAELFKDNFKREVGGCLLAVGGAGKGEGKVTFEPCIEEGENTSNHE